jgi:hypothetical protein
VLLDAGSRPERTEAYPGLYDEAYGPTDAALERAESPLQLFFFFMPPRLWRRVAMESNRYYNQHLNERVDKMYEKQRSQGGDVARDDVQL